MEDEKIYFLPGDIVKLNKSIDNAPKYMYVVKKETRYFKPNELEDKSGYFLGIRCRWFSTDLKLQEAVFSTKDLELK